MYNFNTTLKVVGLGIYIITFLVFNNYIYNVRGTLMLVDRTTITLVIITLIINAKTIGIVLQIHKIKHGTTPEACQEGFFQIIIC